MANVALSGNSVAIIDDADLSLINGFKWRLSGDKYVVAEIDGATVRMHRLIMEVVNNRSVMVDHINGDKLDNRRVNLRLCNVSENNRNTKSHSDNMYSEFKGVTFNKRRGVFYARICVNRKQIHIGSFVSEVEAAVAYDAYAAYYHRDFARLNFPDRVPLSLPEADACRIQRPGWRWARDRPA